MSAVSELTSHDFIAACRTYVKRGKKFPAPADIVEIAENLAYDRSYKTAAARNSLPASPDEHGADWVNPHFAERVAEMRRRLSQMRCYQDPYKQPAVLKKMGDDQWQKILQHDYYPDQPCPSAESRTRSSATSPSTSLS